MKPITCPFCRVEIHNYLFSEKKKGDYFWCSCCGELSLFEVNENLKKPSSKEYAEIWQIENNPKLDDKNYLPTIHKEHIYFNIIYIKDGIYNPDGTAYNYDFYEAQRYLKLLFNKTGTMPQPGDSFQIATKEIKHETFFIVGRGLSINDYEEINLYVVTEERWLNKTLW